MTKTRQPRRRSFPERHTHIEHDQCLYLAHFAGSDDVVAVTLCAIFSRSSVRFLQRGNVHVAPEIRVCTINFAEMKANRGLRTTRQLVKISVVSCAVIESPS